MAKFDPNKPHAKIIRANPQPGAVAFEQNGNQFDTTGKFVGKAEGYKEPAPTIEPEPAASAEDRARLVIGNLDSPHADAARENAAAAAAEESADDAQVD